MPRPHVLLSAAVSLDGRLDDASAARLILSDAADLERVDEVRAGVDAIMVGAGTVRADDPRLLVRSPRHRNSRLRRGLPASPLRVVLTSTGALDPASALFATPGAESLVYTTTSSESSARGRLGPAAQVVGAGEPLSLDAVLADLSSRGVARLMIEGGGSLHTSFLAAGLVDEMQVVIAPFLVGDAAAPRFLHSAAFPQNSRSPMALVEARPMADLALLRYRVGSPDRLWTTTACDLAELCQPSETAFSVGAVVVASDGRLLATGYSRATSPSDHAEEVALASLHRDDPALAGATVYSSLEPCGARASRPVTCAQHIIDAGIRRVVTAWREPSTFVEGRGTEILESAGVTVIEIPELADLARRPNRHLVAKHGRAPRARSSRDRGDSAQ